MQNKLRIKKEAKAQLRLFIPFLLGALSTSATTTADTVMAGLAGTIDLSGVAIGASFYFPCYLILYGIASAITPTVSHLLASKNNKLIQLSVFNALVIGIVIALLTTIALASFHLFFYLIPADKDMMNVTKYYLFYVAAGLPPLYIYLLYKSYFEALSLTKPTLYLGLFQIAVNIPLNYIFIFGHFGFPKLGGVGCGVSTCILQYLCVIGFIWYAKHGKKVQQYKSNEPCHYLNKTLIIQYLKLAIPITLARCFEVLCFSLAALILSPFGPTVVAAHSITLNVSGLIFCMPMCMSMVASIRASTAMGSLNWEQAKLSAKVATYLNLILVTLTFAIYIFVREQIAGLYSNDPYVIAYTASLMLLNCVYLFPDSMQALFGGVLQGLKDSKTIFISTFVSYWIIGLPLGYCLAWGVFTHKFEAYGIWIAFIFALTCASIINTSRAYYIFKNKKMPKLLEQSYKLSQK